MPGYTVSAVDNYTMQICESSSQNGEPCSRHRGNPLHQNCQSQDRQNLSLAILNLGYAVF